VVEQVIRTGERIVLLSEGGMKIAVLIEEGTRKVPGIGVFDTSQLVGQRYGTIARIGNRRFTILRPSIVDRVETLRRKAQIILPKDAALIIMNCDIRAGNLVIEGGSGSGAMTTALANTIWPDGKVISYDIRADFSKQAKENIETLGFANVVTFKEGDVCVPGTIREKDVDAVVLDIPEPWRALKNVYDALKPCGHLACYTPNVNQVEQTVRALQEMDFIEIFTIEALIREMVVVEKGIRPAFDMLGHSGYLTFARKVLEKM